MLVNKCNRSASQTIQWPPQTRVFLSFRSVDVPSILFYEILTAQKLAHGSPFYTRQKTRFPIRFNSVCRSFPGADLLLINRALGTY